MSILPDLVLSVVEISYDDPRAVMAREYCEAIGRDPLYPATNVYGYAVCPWQMLILDARLDNVLATNLDGSTP